MEAAVWRALAVFRALGLAYAAVLYLLRYDEYDHPVGGWLVLTAMAVWTAVTAWVYRRPQGRTWPMLSTDLVVAAATVTATRWLDDPDRISAGAQTLPVVWAAAPVLAFAIKGGWPAGVGAALIIAGADLVHRGGDLSAATVNNIVLLLLAGAVVGYVVSLARRGERALSDAMAVAAATRERERLARDIHDGVLQVLALVSRRGAESGGEAAALGELAGQQEQALRALLTPYRPEVGETDLRALLTPYASDTVTVSAPATPVLMSHPYAREVAAAVGAALANVADHAGPQARAWVLVEDEEDAILVSVRDDGVGFAADRLSIAAAEGRLGVAQSITGRMDGLGGTARFESVPGAGTEVELRVPR